MKVFLDDERQAPDGWTLVRSPYALVGMAMADATDGQVEDITEFSLNHDLGIDPATTSGVVVDGCWVLGQLIEIYGAALPRISIHTQNPVGRAHLRALLDDHARAIIEADVITDDKMATPDEKDARWERSDYV